MKLYHIHRKTEKDALWYSGNQLLVNNQFESELYTQLVKEEQRLIERYGIFEIDSIIDNMEQIKKANLVGENLKEDFEELLRRYYFLRREKALEEGRKRFNPDAPSRFHSIFLTEKESLAYWKTLFTGASLKLFLIEGKGNLFISSDLLFPIVTFPFELQVEQSKDYWCPKQPITKQKELLFQGTCTILKQELDW